MSDVGGTQNTGHNETQESEAEAHCVLLEKSTAYG